MESRANSCAPSTPTSPTTPPGPPCPPCGSGGARSPAGTGGRSSSELGSDGGDCQPLPTTVRVTNGPGLGGGWLPTTPRNFRELRGPGTVGCGPTQLDIGPGWSCLTSVRLRRCSSWIPMAPSSLLWVQATPLSGCAWMGALSGLAAFQDAGSAGLASVCGAGGGSDVRMPAGRCACAWIDGRGVHSGPHPRCSAQVFHMHPILLEINFLTS